MSLKKTEVLRKILFINTNSNARKFKKKEISYNFEVPIATLFWQSKQQLRAFDKKYPNSKFLVDGLKQNIHM